MVESLLILDSSYVGSRDLWWADVPEATHGYNVYRAFDYPANWTKLTTVPVGGHFYRDMTSLTETTYTLQPLDWMEQGELGRWAFRIPDPPFSRNVVGRPTITNDPADIMVTVSATGNFPVDGQSFRPVKVDGFDRGIWMQMDNTLPEGGAVTAFPLASDGVAWEGDWSKFAHWQVTYYKVNNMVDIYTALNRTFYTVVPIGEDHHETHAPGARGSTVKNTQEVDQISWEFQEMVNRNQWIFEEVGEPAYLMFRKWRGEQCGCTTTLQQGKTGCKSCFETGFVGGYIGPYDMLFVPPDSALMRELNEGGIKTTRDSRSFLTRTPIVQNGDLIIRRNGDRNVISNVIYKSPRGVIVQQDFTVSLLSPGDTRYLIPLNNNLPTIFNPVVRRDENDGTGGGQPIFDPRTVPGNTWENVNVPIGRTVTFGKLV
jgi:hypothetical protein